MRGRGNAFEATEEDPLYRSSQQALNEPSNVLMMEYDCVSLFVCME